MTTPEVTTEQINTLPHIIAIDFDGTLCEDKFPQIGVEHTAVIELMKAHQQRGSEFILWTCRTNQFLDEAIAWCKERGLEFAAINDNHPAVIALGWDARKIYADQYWDDKAVVFEYA